MNSSFPDFTESELSQLVVLADCLVVMRSSEHFREAVRLCVKLNGPMSSPVAYALASLNKELDKWDRNGWTLDREGLFIMGSTMEMRKDPYTSCMGWTLLGSVEKLLP